MFAEHLIALIAGVHFLSIAFTRRDCHLVSFPTLAAYFTANACIGHCLIGTETVLDVTAVASCWEHGIAGIYISVLIVFGSDLH